MGTYVLRHRGPLGPQRHTWTDGSRNLDFSGCLRKQIQISWELMAAVTRKRTELPP